MNAEEATEIELLQKNAAQKIAVGKGLLADTENSYQSEVARNITADSEEI